MQAIELYKELFQNNEIRIYGTTNNPLFVANDIGSLLGIKNIHTSLINFDEHEKAALRLTYGSSGAKQTTVLTTAGLYRVLYASKKPIAADFRKWVASVLDTIRLKGTYNLKEEIEKEQRSRLESDAEKDNEIIALRNENSRLSLTYKPTVVYHTYDINDFANEPCVYLIQLTDIEFKFGITNNIVVRIRDHANHFAKHSITPIIVKMWKCNSSIISQAIEKSIKEFAKSHKLKIAKYNMTEIIETDNVGYIVSRIDKYIEKHNTSYESNSTITLAKFEIEKMRLAIELKVLENAQYLTIVEKEKIALANAQCVAEVEKGKIALANAQCVAEVEKTRCAAEVEKEKIALEREKIISQRSIDEKAVEQTQIAPLVKSTKRIAKEWLAANKPIHDESVVDHYKKYRAAHPAGLEKPHMIKLIKDRGFRIRKSNRRTRWQM